MSLSIARVSADDVEPLDRALEEDGWPRPRDQLQRYLADQDAGARVFLMARDATAIAGYLTLTWEPDYPPFRDRGIPEIQDLNVLPSHRRRGVASRLMDAAECEASSRSTAVGLGVGLYAGYGPAQRLYVLRGYVPDGRGAAWGSLLLQGGETVSVDDHLVLHLVKELVR